MLMLNCACHVQFFLSKTVNINISLSTDENAVRIKLIGRNRRTNERKISSC